MATIQVLDNSDFPLLDAFLLNYRDSSMFLRANSRRSGLAYRPEPFHALYAAAFENEQLTGVAAHGWNGMLMLQVPGANAEIQSLVRACAEWSGRKVTGLSGPLDQVRVAREALGLSNSPVSMDSDEWLYGLDLSDLVVPAALSSGVVVCRAPRKEERDTLCQWRLAYDIESLGSSDSMETRERSTRTFDIQMADGNAWVAVDHGQPVSLSAFNSSLPDIVQLGGIYTPPELRGRGYAKASVAGSLLAACERGATRAVLFTSNPSAARSYEAVGFRRVGDYGLVLFR